MTNRPDVLILNLKRRMLDREMTQKELAKKAGVSEPYLSCLFSGKQSPSLYIFCKLCNALDIRIELKVLKGLSWDL